MSDKWQRILKKMVVAQPWHLPSRTEDNDKTTSHNSTFLMRVPNVTVTQTRSACGLKFWRITRING
jgi:hypothetical protein